MLHYDKLYAFDVTGRKLPASLALSNKFLSILVDDRKATYPITIDPLLYTETKLLASDAERGDRFGLSVAISGNTALIGAPIDDDKGFNSGSAYVFVRHGTVWTEQAKLLSSDEAANDRFGSSVAISGETALIGTSPAGLNPQIGSAYVFVWNGTVWTEQAKLVASDGEVNDRFSRSVAIDEGTALIGAPQDDDSGSAYVFVRNGTEWSEQAKLLASDGVAKDFFGSSVAISRETALIGASGDDVNGTSSGSAYVFVRNGVESGS